MRFKKGGWVKHNQQQWLKLPLGLLHHKELSLSAKLIYVYMLWRFQFFTKVQKASYFEAQETIADATGVSRKTVNESIQALAKLGFVSYKKTKQSSVYEVKDTYKIYSTNKKEEPMDFEEPF